MPSEGGVRVNWYRRRNAANDKIRNSRTRLLESSLGHRLRTSSGSGETHVSSGAPGGRFLSCRKLRSDYKMALIRNARLLPSCIWELTHLTMSVGDLLLRFRKIFLKCRKVRKFQIIL